MHLSPSKRTTTFVPRYSSSLGMARSQGMGYAHDAPKPALCVDDRAHDHGRIQADPADAGEEDVLVALAQSVPEPEQGREQVGAPGEQRDARGLMSDPDDP